MKEKLKGWYKQVGLITVMVLVSGGRLIAGVADPAPAIDNPISSNTFKEFLTDILNIVIEIGTPVVIIAIILVGFKFVTAQGKPGEIEKAKAAFFWVVIGAAIVIGCKVIVEIIEDTVEVISLVTNLLV